MRHIAVVGAGISGAVISYILARKGYKITIFESRSHIAGNCHTERDAATGIMVHVYGPHIFHTDDEEIWQFVNSFSPFIPFVNRVKNTVGGNVYSFPINLHTINQFYNKAFRPDEARKYIEEHARATIHQPQTFEEQAFRLIGSDLYEAFFKGYTRKHWGCDPKLLPASILRRLPIRFDYNDNYFAHKYQGIPEFGYTRFIEKILNQPNISIELNRHFDRNQVADFEHVFHSGSIDSFFSYAFGPLDYRTLDFERFYYNGDYQGCAVMNFSDLSVPFTRITEHKYLSPWEENSKSVCYREYSRSCGENDIPYYPIPLPHNHTKLHRYNILAKKLENVTFVGRLGTYCYLDMDVSIRRAMEVARQYIGEREKKL